MTMQDVCSQPPLMTSPLVDLIKKTPEESVQGSREQAIFCPCPVSTKCDRYADLSPLELPHKLQCAHLGRTANHQGASAKRENTACAGQ